MQTYLYCKVLMREDDPNMPAVIPTQIWAVTRAWQVPARKSDWAAWLMGALHASWLLQIMIGDMACTACTAPHEAAMPLSSTYTGSILLTILEGEAGKWQRMPMGRRPQQ